jgi:hypothetical protein
MFKIHAQELNAGLCERNHTPDASLAKPTIPGIPSTPRHTTAPTSPQPDQGPRPTPPPLNHRGRRVKPSTGRNRVDQKKSRSQPEVLSEHTQTCYNRSMEATNVQVKQDQFLFLQGQDADGMYILARGKMRVQTRDSEGQIHHLSELEAGSVIGEMALFDGRPRSADVYALTDCELKRIPLSTWETMSAQLPKWLVGLVRVMSQRLRQRNSVADQSQVKHPLLAYTLWAYRPLQSGAIPDYEAWLQKFCTLTRINPTTAQMLTLELCNRKFLDLAEQALICREPELFRLFLEGNLARAEGQESALEPEAYTKATLQSLFQSGPRYPQAQKSEWEEWFVEKKMNMDLMLKWKILQQIQDRDLFRWNQERIQALMVAWENPQRFSLDLS